MTSPVYRELLPFMLATLSMLIFTAPVYSLEPSGSLGRGECDYAMCQYEQDNIDTVIIEHAKASQTVMFGEIHDTALADLPPPIEDSLYVATLLIRLKKIGYTYLALEVNHDAAPPSHSYDMVRFYQTYHRGDPVNEQNYPNAKPGWISLLKQAVDLGYTITFIDSVPENRLLSTPRDMAMFQMLKREIFDNDPSAKILIYIGAYHVGELESRTGIYMHDGRRKPLGSYLDDYTHGKNYSVYMGHTRDTPLGCDLVISYFIWGTFHVDPKRSSSISEPW